MSSLPPNLAFLSRRIIIVVYNLTGVPAAYSPLYEAISNLGQWWHYIPNTWLIDTNSTPQHVFNSIQPHLLAGDHIFIGTLQNGYWGALPKDAWEWLTKHGLSL